MSRPEPMRIGGQEIRAGQRRTIDLPVARLYTHTAMDLTVHVWRGKKPGPCLMVSAAIHGDEVLGVEIIQRLLKLKALGRMRGTLITIPIVNVFGFIYQSRYLPDRRDLNRSFPGSEKGSLAARLAHLFIEEIVSKCTHGIDLHTGSNHRSNLPQIRASLDSPETARLARSFGTPVILHADGRDGSLRQTVLEKGIPMLLYEAGEALRFNETAIRIGLRGVISVMRAIGMLADRARRKNVPEPVVARSSYWERAPVSGILTNTIPLGARVVRGAPLGTISDPFGETEVQLEARSAGVVIGHLKLPLVHKGDAVCHIARLGREEEVASPTDLLGPEMLSEDEDWLR